MNILIIGSGGREHALAWKMSQSKRVSQLFACPGNAGTAKLCKNVAIPPTDFEALAAFCIDNNIQMIVVGSEETLVKGIKDFFAAHPLTYHLAVIGPDQQGAQLEGSKDFAKNFMVKYQIPTAGYKSFHKSALPQALQYIQTHPLPIVIKADGLAAGKGVVIAQTYQEAQKTLQEMLEEAKFGEASDTVVIEEFLEGIEMSAFVLCDGKNYLMLPTAKDYKRIGEGDTGLNTGGMGAVSPVPFADALLMQKVEERIVKPTLQGLATEKIDYRGFIFIGLMCVAGEPYVIEYNVRLGDPETEAILPRIHTDWVTLMEAVAQQKLDTIQLEVSDDYAATLFLVSGGYPEAFERHKKIEGLDQIQETFVFHAGTTQDSAGQIITQGGRVIAITALAPTLQQALQQANHSASLINFEKKYFRKDIGYDLFPFLK
ncbi:MAG TPA: phosphoribosylamine--glycine ligase [Microscillaceae bacterium]|nr:phosphoribosylamine--glycine ligase [Microscillaceae bacterium]